MAMVYLRSHNESIYSVENDSDYQRMHQQEWGKSKRRESSGLYVSKFHNLVKSEVPAKRAAHKTMGYAQTPLTSPCNFLKKHAGIRWKVSTDHKCIRQPIPPIPKRGAIASKPPNDSLSPSQCQDTQTREQAASANTGNRKLNSREKCDNKGERPQLKLTRPRFVDSCCGDSHDLFSSGLMPQYIFRPTFGKVPDYLVERRKHSAAANQSYIQDCKEGMMEPAGPKYVSQEERQALLSGLKANWEKLQNRYQGLPVLTDTEPKKIAKVKLERELKQLEQDIMLLENNPHIYVCDNST